MSWDIGEEGKECVRMAFEITERLQAQSVAFDFVNECRWGIQNCGISYCSSPKGDFPRALGVLG